MKIDRIKRRRSEILSSGAGAMLSMFVTFVGTLPQPVAAAAPIGLELTIERSGHTATVLQGNKVLIVGGKNTAGTAIPSAEVVDLADPTSAQNAVGSLTGPRTEHTATPLSSGDILVAGGSNGSTALDTTELFNHADATWSAGSPLQAARAGHTATLLADGNVLIVGGDATGTAEIYGSSGLVSLNTPRSKHSAIRLNDGKVLIVGGVGSDNAPLTSAELYDPATSTFTTVPTSLAVARVKPDLRLLPDGKVQVIGGADDGSFEMYDPDENNAKPGFNAKVQAVNATTSINEVLNAQTRGAILFDGSVVPGGPLSDILNRNGAAATEIAQPAVSGVPQASKVLISGGVSSTAETGHHSAYVVDGSPATITTNATDYAPGTDVYVYAKGWIPGETVDFMLHKVKADGVVVDWAQPVSWTVDSNGELNGYAIYQPVAPDDIDAKFTLTAVGQESGFVAQTGFTDAAPTTPTATINQVNLYTPQSPNPLPAGGSANYVFDVVFNQSGTAGNNSCTVAMTIETGGGTGLPMGATALFSPPTITASGNTTQQTTLTVSTTNLITPGTYTFNVVATGTGGTTNDCSTSNNKKQGVSLIVSASSKVTPIVTVTGGSFTYDGNPHQATATAIDPNTNATVPGSFTFTYTPPGDSTTPVNAATYSVTANFTPTNTATYNNATGTGSITINKAPVTATAGSGSGTFNGSVQSPSDCAVTGTYTVGLSCTNNPTSVGPDAGTYTIEPVVSGNTSNFEVTLANGSYVIDKATSTTTVTCPASVIYDGSAHEPCTAKASGVGMTDVDVSDSIVYENNTEVGTATATAHWDGDANHYGSNGTGHFVIGFHFYGFLQPLNDPAVSTNTPSVWKKGSNIPIKFQLKDGNGNLISDALAKDIVDSCATGEGARISITKNNGSTSTAIETETTSSPTADSGVCFRYDATSHQFIYNLGTKTSFYASGTSYQYKTSASVKLNGAVIASHIQVNFFELK